MEETQRTPGRIKHSYILDIHTHLDVSWSNCWSVGSGFVILMHPFIIKFFKACHVVLPAATDNHCLSPPFLLGFFFPKIPFRFLLANNTRSSFYYLKPRINNHCPLSSLGASCLFVGYTISWVNLNVEKGLKPLWKHEGISSFSLLIPLWRVNYVPSTILDPGVQ